MTPEPVPSPAGGIESAASVAPGSSERVNPWSVETMNANETYTKATGDGWVEFFVDSGRHVVRAAAERDEGLALLDTIAAAPALLAAAKNMVLAFDYGDADSEMDALRQIKEAIAEATPARPDQHYGSGEGLETVLEIVRGWDDREVCRFLAECWPGKIVRVGDEVIRHDEATGEDEILA